MKKKVNELTEKDLKDAIKVLDSLKEWQYLVTFRKVFPFITIEKTNVITLGDLTEYRTFQIARELSKKVKV